MNTSNRRRFIGDTGKAALTGMLLAGTVAGQTKEMKNVFVHHVYFWLKNPSDKGDREKLLSGLKKLSAVKTIRQFHIGKPADTSRSVIDGSYTVSWLVLFDNKADQDNYQSDPIHLKFVEECSSLWERVVVYDSIDA